MATTTGANSGCTIASTSSAVLKCPLQPENAERSACNTARLVERKIGQFSSVAYIVGESESRKKEWNWLTGLNRTRDREEVRRCSKRRPELFRAGIDSRLAS